MKQKRQNKQKEKQQSTSTCYVIIIWANHAKLFEAGMGEHARIIGGERER